MKRTTILRALVLFALVGLLNGALVMAMSSTSYRLNWFTPLVGSGGAASSSHYAVNLTVGQASTGYTSSGSYTSGLGYWYGVGQSFRVYGPIVLRQ